MNSHFRWTSRTAGVALAISLVVPVTALAARKPTPGERSAIVAAARDRTGQHGFTVTNIVVSTKGPWARAELKPTHPHLDTAVAVLQKTAHGWKVRDEGTDNVGCAVAPAAVLTDLKLICDG